MRSSLLAALLAVTSAFGLFAQADGTGRGDRTAPTPAEMVERRVQRLTTLLTLDAAQQAQAKTIFTDEVTAATALRDKAEAAQDALQAAVKASASDSQIDQLSNAIGTVHAQSVAVHAKAQAKFRAILNSAQKEKLDASRAGFGGPGGPGRFGPMRGRAPQF